MEVALDLLESWMTMAGKVHARYGPVAKEKRVGEK